MSESQAKQAYITRIPVCAEINGFVQNGFITSIDSQSELNRENVMFQVTSVHPRRNVVERLFYYANEIQLLGDAE